MELQPDSENSKRVKLTVDNELEYMLVVQAAADAAQIIGPNLLVDRLLIGVMATSEYPHDISLKKRQAARIARRLPGLLEDI